MNRALLLFACALAAAGCYPDHSFDCLANDARCAAGERCFVDKCAAPDDTCSGGYRYTSSTGDVAGTCLGSAPDGGVPCTHTGDSCDDGDPCTVGDKCAGTKCAGTPMVCTGMSCAAGVLSTDTCVAGQCVPKTSMCSPYACSGKQCAVACTTGADCASGFYCASGKCLSCGDYLTDPGFFPVFGASAPIPGVNMSLTADVTPSLSSDGLTLYFASARAGGMGGLDLWQATRTVADETTPFGSVVDLGGINSSGDDVDPFTSDGKSFLFSSDRAMKGNFDLFASTLAMAMFSPPAAPAGGDMAGPLDTTGSERHPTLTSDGKRLYFASDRGSPAAGDPLPNIYGASRADAMSPFGSASATSGLDPFGAWTSPSVSRAGGALFLVNAAVPSRSEAAVVHLDANGAPTGQMNLLRAIDLTGGGSASLSADGCALLYSNTSVDAPGDLAWSFRSGLISCAQAPCGAGDGCCPAKCANLIDPDCPYPRTVELTEYANMINGSVGNHLYLLDGETPPAGYTTTGAPRLRIFRDALPGSTLLSRWVSTTPCDIYGAYYKLGIEASAPTGFKLDLAVGYVFPMIMGTRGVTRLWRAIREVAPFCDEQLSFDNTNCTKLQQMNMGYACDSSLGFAVSP